MGLYRKYAAILEKMLFSIFMGKKTAKNGLTQQGAIPCHAFTCQGRGQGLSTLLRIAMVLTENLGH